MKCRHNIKADQNLSNAKVHEGLQTCTLILGEYITREKIIVNVLYCAQHIQARRCRNYTCDDISQLTHINKFISMFGNFVKYSQSLNDSFLCFVDFMLLYYIQEAKPLLQCCTPSMPSYTI